MAIITPVEIFSSSSPWSPIVVLSPNVPAVFDPGTGRVGVGVLEGVRVPEDVRVADRVAESLPSSVGCGVEQREADGADVEEVLEGVKEGSGWLLPGLGRVGVGVLDGVRV